MGSVDVLQPNKYAIPFRRWNYMPKSNPNPNFNGSAVSRKRTHGRIVILKHGNVLDDVTNTYTYSNGVLKGDDEKSKKPLAKAAKFEGAVEKVDVDLKDHKKVKCEGCHVKKVTAAVNAKDDLVLLTRNQLGPKPEMVQSVPEFYAGFSFVSSPSPTSLPLPAFLVKKTDPSLVA